MPTLTTKYVTPEQDIIFHSENGIIGMGPPPSSEDEDDDLRDAGKNFQHSSPVLRWYIMRILLRSPATPNGARYLALFRLLLMVTSQIGDYLRTRQYRRCNGYRHRC